MGITKRAVTVIGVRVPVDDISHVETVNENLCKCSPQTTGVNFCPECGMNTNRQQFTRRLEDFVQVMDGASQFEVAPTIDGYPMAGNWHYDNYVYVGCLVSSTKAAYSGGSVDPVKSNDLVGGKLFAIEKFKGIMEERGMWKSEEFGIWTMMISE